MNRSDLRKMQKKIGATTMEVAIAADLHPQTLYRVYNGDETISRNTINRVRKALSYLQGQLGATSKIAG